MGISRTLRTLLVSAVKGMEQINRFVHEVASTFPMSQNYEQVLLFRFCYSACIENTALGSLRPALEFPYSMDNGSIHCQ